MTAVQYLVTGGTGFIGAHLVRRLVASYGPGAVTCLVLPGEAAGDERLIHLRESGVRLIEGDLLEPGVAAERAPKPSVVFHLAANIDTAGDEASMRLNDAGVAHLLDWLGPDVAGARVVFTSSVAALDRDRPAEGPLTDESPCAARTAYGRSKHRAERLLRERATLDGFTFTTLRLPTVYGVGQKPGGLFDSLRSLAERGAWLARLNWPGRTSVMHLDDLVTVLVDLAHRPEAAGRTLGLASPDVVTVGELAQAVARTVGRPRRPIELPPWFWAGVRRAVWHPVVCRLVPPRYRLHHWRLSLMVDDGFWMDPGGFRELYPARVMRLEEGLRLTFPRNDQER
ncbi:MAG TPA: NAD(P)-dependent oxidoreductase [Vicinamibacterales bacterium]|nr:NAD(P)-dependent oxidoreductase [Vicinamibacterales bacterium]